jgi:hypothetical protein
MRSPRGGVPYDGTAPVREVRVRYVETFYTGSSLSKIRDDVIHVVEIPSDADFGGARERVAPAIEK